MGRGRVIGFGLVLGLLMTLLVGRLGQVQLLGHADFAAAAERLNTRTLVIPAVRGRILDRAGKPLADNTSQSVVTLDRRVVMASQDHGLALVTAMAALLRRPVSELHGRTYLCGEDGAPQAPVCFSGSAQAPIPLASGVDPAVALSLLERPERFPGVGVEARALRRYPAPDGANAAHLLGYLGRVTEAEVASSGGLLTGDDLVGRSGLEQQYDRQLRGTPGRMIVAVDPRGLVTHVVSTTPPTPGLDLVTSIDARVQARTEAALVAGVRAARARKEKADSAAATVLDSRTGAVIAMASWPAYDPNVWSGGIEATDYARLTNPAAGTPLLSRAIGTIYPPASTFKAFSLQAAVRGGARLDGTYECSSAYQVGNRAFHNFESRAYGPISLHRAIEISCDTVFYAFAHQAWLAQGGLAAKTDAKDPFIAIARGFGLGSATGIDLPGESGGRIPGREWRRATWEAGRADTCARANAGYPDVAAKDPARAAYLKALATENCTEGGQFRPGDAVNFSIGQGDVGVTPTQMAVAYAAIANGGRVLTPRVGSRFLPSPGADGATTAGAAVPAGPARKAPLDPRVAPYLRSSLRAVVVSGTAAHAFAGMPADWPVAGKTGTGEVFGFGDTGWFVSYAPANAPRFAVSVVISQGGTGGTSAAPAARLIHEALRTLR